MDWTQAIAADGPPLRREAPAGVTTPARAWPQSRTEFEAMVDALQHRLVQFAFCRLQVREDAEDVVQDVLVQAYRDREKHKGVTSADPFLFRMVANRCTDVLRKRRRSADIPAEVCATETEDSASRLRRMEALLSRLPSRQAEAIRLRIFGELPFEAVAQAAGCSVPTVKSRFRYGIQKLRKALKRAGGEK
jgi:RNA polymerase sigma-70 factor, ECF subfamily